ncbi:hypothetical protein NSS64_32655 [Paenibacillus sp. FSL H8-0122]
MKDWVQLINSLVSLLTALVLLIKAAKEPNKKGTKKRSPRGKRK